MSYYREKIVNGRVVERVLVDDEVITPPPPVLTVSNISIKFNDVESTPFNSLNYCNVGDTIQVTGALTLNDVVQDITYPITLKMPVIRSANGQPTNDEIYLNVTLVNGILTSTGVIPRSGDWKISIDRNNAALKVIGAPFELNAQDITILA